MPLYKPAKETTIRVTIGEGEREVHTVERWEGAVGNLCGEEVINRYSNPQSPIDRRGHTMNRKASETAGV